MSEASPDPIKDVQAKSKDFLEKAKSGTLDEGTLKWGLSAGAVVSGVSLFFNYFSYDVSVFGIPASGRISGWDLLSFRYGNSLDGLMALAIPLSALFGLYLQFGEPALKLLKLETQGRSKTIYLIGMIVAALGVIGCFRFLSHQVCLGSLLGLVGLAVLAFVYFKLWKASSEAPAVSSAPPPPPAN